MVRSGQASTEFFTTYGWAFLLLVVLIGGISYFGVEDRSLFVSERCSFPSSDVSCDDFLITASEPGGPGVVLLTLRQHTGRTAYVEDLSCSSALSGVTARSYAHARGTAYQGTDRPLADWGSLLEWQPSDRITLKCLFADERGGNPLVGLSGESLSSDLVLSFRKREDGFTHRAEGSVVGVVS